MFEFLKNFKVSRDDPEIDRRFDDSVVSGIQRAFDSKYHRDCSYVYYVTYNGRVGELILFCSEKEHCEVYTIIQKHRNSCLTLKALKPSIPQIPFAFSQIP